MRISFLSAAAVLCLGAPALAQTSVPTPAHEANSAGTAPSTAAANDAVATSEAARQGAIQAGNLDAEAQYAADMASYEAALRANRRENIANEARWHRQQRAYADAMAAWRVQVAACERGNDRACKAPTPDPAAFY